MISYIEISRPSHGRSDFPKLPDLKGGCSLDILTYAFTQKGWSVLKSRLPELGMVRVITCHISEAALRQCTQENIEVRQHPANHAKALIFRQAERTLFGSFNITYRSQKVNVESATIEGGEVHEQFITLFEELWAQATAAQPYSSGFLFEEVEILGEDRLPIGDTEKPSMGKLKQLMDRIKTVSKAPAIPRTPPTSEYSILDPADFQGKLIEEIATWIANAGNKPDSRILTLPTGAGKTLIAAEAIKRVLQNRGSRRFRVLWCCHRKELLNQSFKRVYAQLGIPDGNFWVASNVLNPDVSNATADEFREIKDKNIVFCTQQSIKRMASHRQLSNFDLIVVDEAHRYHHGSENYKKLESALRRTNNCLKLGMTATPLPGDRQDFWRYWDPDYLFGQSITKECLRKIGFLAEEHGQIFDVGFQFQVKSGQSEQKIESEILTRVGEFDNHEVNEGVVRAFEKLSRNYRRILLFAVNIEHANTLAERYFGSVDGIRVVHSKIHPYSKIRENLEWFLDDADETRMLISVMLLVEGIDLPNIDCLFMVRPTFSPILHTQMMGRGLRGRSVLGGTESCEIVDFTYQFVDNRGGPIDGQMTHTLKSQHSFRDDDDDDYEPDDENYEDEEDEEDDDEAEQDHDEDDEDDDNEDVDPNRKECDFERIGNLTLAEFREDEDAIDCLIKCFDYSESTINSYLSGKHGKTLVRNAFPKVGCWLQSAQGAFRK